MNFMKIDLKNFLIFTIHSLSTIFNKDYKLQTNQLNCVEYVAY